MSKQPSFRDLTELSAYLDGELNASAHKKMENRLARDPELAAALDDLRLSRIVLRRTPKRRAPRSFTLSPQMVAKRPPMPRLIPALNYASLMAMLLLVFSFLGPVGLGGQMANEAVESAPMMMEESALAEGFAAAEEPAMEMAAPPPAADSVMENDAPAEEEMPAVAEPAERTGENLTETQVATLPVDEAEAGVDAEKAYTATVIPTPRVIPTPVVPSHPEPEPVPLLTPYQRTLVILLGIFVILGWALRRVTVAKWREKAQ